MEKELVTQLNALAHANRLDLFRLLVRRYPAGVPAGEIATALDFKPNTASAYLATLKQADLIRQERQGTSLIYSANLDGVRGLFGGLLTGCCQNRPDICHSLASAPIAQPTPERPLKVLFLCTGNSARSILAEALLRREGAGKFQVFSAGTRPASKPSPVVLQLLQSKGYDTSELNSKQREVYAGPEAPKMDFIFTVCDHAANEECPTWPGQPMSAHWGLSDPLKAQGSEAERHLALLEAYATLKTRIKSFAALPFDTLDRISLQHQTDAIGGQIATN